MAYLSDSQKVGLYTLIILCVFALIMTWSVIGYKTAQYHAQHPTDCGGK